MLQFIAVEMEFRNSCNSHTQTHTNLFSCLRSGKNGFLSTEEQLAIQNDPYKTARLTCLLWNHPVLRRSFLPFFTLGVLIAGIFLNFPRSPTVVHRWLGSFYHFPLSVRSSSVHRSALLCWGRPLHPALPNQSRTYDSRHKSSAAPVRATTVDHSILLFCWCSRGLRLIYLWSFSLWHSKNHLHYIKAEVNNAKQMQKVPYTFQAALFT